MATRRSRLQFKPNTSRGNSEGSAKPAPAAARPAAASPKKSVTSARPPDAVQVSTDPPLPEAAVEPPVSSAPAAESPMKDKPAPAPPPLASSEEPPAKASPVEAASEPDKAKPNGSSGKGRGRPRLPKPNLATVRVPKRRPVETVEVAEEERDATHEEQNGSVPDAVEEERRPEGRLPSPPPRSVPKSSAEKRARKENKELHARKRRQYRSGGKGAPPDRSSMTMMDLIYYNPPGNPMPEKAPKTTVVEEVVEENPPREEEAPAGAEEEESVGPRVRVGPDGEITIDEESLVIRREPTREDSRAVVYETGTETHYGSFRKRPFGRRLWSSKETARFYRALSVCGTDFTLMSTFFPKRTRQDLKNKFKREERFNRELVDKAINDPTQFDTVGLEDEEDEDEEVDNPDDPDDPGKEERATAPPRKRRKGRPPKKPSPEEPAPVAETEVLEDPTADNVVHIVEEEQSETPPQSTPPVSTSDRESVPQGQLVFYASHAQEQVVHVFVVSPQANVSPSELVSRLGTPPLNRRTTPRPASSNESPAAPPKTPPTRPWSLLAESLVPLAKLSSSQRQQLESEDARESEETTGNFRTAPVLPKGITPLARESATPQTEG